MPQLQANTTINNLAMQTGTSLDLNGKIFTINGTVTQTGTAVFKGSPTSNLYLNGAQLRVLRRIAVRADAHERSCGPGGTAGLVEAGMPSLRIEDGVVEPQCEGNL